MLLIISFELKKNCNSEHIFKIHKSVFKIISLFSTGNKKMIQKDKIMKEMNMIK